MKTVVGLFETRTQAREALNQLSAAGFDPQLVSVIANRQRANPANVSKPPDRQEAIREEIDKNTIRTAYSSIAYWLLTPGPIGTSGATEIAAQGPAARSFGETIPSQGVDVEGTPAPGGLRKALANWGLSKGQIDDYEKRVAQGAILMAVEVVDDSMVARAEEILLGDRADDVAASPG
jgi:hypothetical protein